LVYFCVFLTKGVQLYSKIEIIMSNTTRTQYRIDPILKENAEKILIKIGIKPAQAIAMFYSEIARTGTFPFLPTKVLKEEISKEIEKTEKGIGIKKYKNKEDLFSSLDNL